MNPWKKNPVTGQLETTFNAKVVSIGETTVANKNGTEYVIGSIELPTGKTVSARVLSSHADRIEVGKDHLINATQYADANGVEQIDLRIAPLTGAERATAADMAFLGTVVETASATTKVSVGAEPVEAV